jgi:hypothetical protein
VLTVSRGTTLDGIVKMAGSPCAYGAVEINGPVVTTETIRNGRVHFDGLWAGRYLAMVACSMAPPPSRDMTDTVGVEDWFSLDGAPATRHWNIEQAGTADEGGSIHLSIVSDDSDPLQFSASILKESTPHATRGRREGDGFVFDHLGFGKYDAFLDQSPSTVLSVILTRDEPHAELRLSAPEASFISGRVLDMDQHSVADAWVRAYHRKYVLPEVAAAGVPALTNSEGYFTIMGLVAGEYSIRVDSPLGHARLERVRGGERNAQLRLLSLEPSP